MSDTPEASASGTAPETVTAPAVAAPAAAPKKPRKAPPKPTPEPTLPAPEAEVPAAPLFTIRTF